MIEGINIDQRIEFTLDDDKEPKTVFLFRPISGTDMLNIQSRAKGLPEGEAIAELLSVTIAEIVGVENKHKFLRSLPIEVLNKLIDKHTEINILKDDDQKN
jgi:hypothetical protein